MFLDHLERGRASERNCYPTFRHIITHYLQNMRRVRVISASRSKGTAALVREARDFVIRVRRHDPGDPSSIDAKVVTRDAFAMENDEERCWEESGNDGARGEWRM